VSTRITGRDDYVMTFSTGLVPLSSDSRDDVTL
jgi:hypothetical protein